MHEDPDYDPEKEPLGRKKGRVNRAPPRRRAKKSSVLTQEWPKIKKLYLAGDGPTEIAETINLKLPAASQIDNKQISNLIGRKKRQGEIPGNPKTKSNPKA